MFTEALPFLSAADQEWVMGKAICALARLAAMILGRHCFVALRAPRNDGLEVDRSRGRTMTDRVTLYGSFTSSSSYKPMLYLARWRGVSYDFKTVKLNKGHQKLPEYLAINRYGHVAGGCSHRGLTIVAVET